MTLNQRIVKKGEALAILPEAVHSGPKGIWWDMPNPVPENRYEGSTAIVYVRGSLEHHEGIGGDSYDAILERVKCALEEEPENLVLCIDSPGGVVSGLNETVFAIRKLTESIHTVAYVDELAASAAYALSCSCDEIVMPASAIAGSIGVISTLFDQTRADEKMGIKVVTLTSGARKADGHPHVAISDAALNAEQRRVDRLAKQFFKLVAEVRPISIGDIEALQAGIFLGKEAETKGLADAVMGWDELMSHLDTDQNNLAKSSQDVSHPKTQPAQPGARGDSEMLVSLKASIKRTTAALASAKDPQEKKKLTAALAAYGAALEAYKKTKHSIEKHETEEGEEEDEESEEESEEASGSEEDDEEESEESEAKKAKGNETDRKEKKAKADDSGDDDEDDDGEEDDDEEAAAAKKTAKAIVSGGALGRRALGQLTAMAVKARKYDALAERVAKIEGNARRAEKNALIDEAVAQRRIPRHMAKVLRGKKIDFVKGTLEMHKTPMVAIDDEALLVPDGTPNADLPASVMSGIDATVEAAASQADKLGFTAEKQAELRTSLITAHRERMAKANGAGGRY